MKYVDASLTISGNWLGIGRLLGLLVGSEEFFKVRSRSEKARFLARLEGRDPDAENIAPEYSPTGGTSSLSLEINAEYEAENRPGFVWLDIREPRFIWSAERLGEFVEAINGDPEASVSIELDLQDDEGGSTVHSFGRVEG